MSRPRASLLLALWLAASLGLPGCRSHAGPVDTETANTQGGKRYPIQGKVVGINAASGEVELEAAAIPGYMDAMTMPYKLKDPAVLGELHPGDTLRATLIVTDTTAVLDQIVITGQSKPVARPATDLHPLVPGEAVPDFSLLNQSGRQVHLADYRGRLLLITFVYTRCPLADYCPRMSRNFALVDKALAADPNVYKQTHLLSISFDPKYDTPSVLRSYGGAYTGNYTHENFDHWEFAAPSEQDLAKLLSFFDVAATPEQNKTVTHSLSTVAIDPNGKVYKWYGSNDWTPAQVVADIKAALGQKA